MFHIIKTILFFFIPLYHTKRDHSLKSLEVTKNGRVHLALCCMLEDRSQSQTTLLHKSIEATPILALYHTQYSSNLMGKWGLEDLWNNRSVGEMRMQ